MATEQTTTHPLDPLSSAEIAAATAILRASREIGASYRFVSVSLREPPKEQVVAFRDGDRVDREAFAVMFDHAHDATYETVISLSRGEVLSWTHIPEEEPAISLDEMAQAEEVVRRDPEFIAALRRRGLDDPDRVVLDAWAPGNHGDEESGRILRSLPHALMNGEDDNEYAHPVENLIAYVDLNRMEVMRIEDLGVVAVPTAPGNYTRQSMGTMRDDARPIEITQPEGPSFELDGHEVRWQKWRIRIGFTPREGLVLHTVGFQDGGRLRPILYRASLSEMVVPYGDPAPTHARKCAFDVGEYQIGTLANSLELGCDCLGEIRYFDAVLADRDGTPYTLPNAICVHEEDHGLLWKHTNFRTMRAEVRRSRRLVISSIVTVGNYDYGVYWYFQQDGTIELEIKLTGILSTGALPPGERPEYGQLLDPGGLYGPIHQHFISVRLDIDVDGQRNSIEEIHTESAARGEANPLGNAFRAVATPMRTESEAKRVVDPLSARHWKVINPAVLNHVGEPVSYKLVPGENTLPFSQPDAPVIRRGRFATKHLWVTPYAPGEMHAAGDYPNQHEGGAGLEAWTKADRRIEDADVVVWYTIGVNHVVRLEDWPIMPVQHAGFTLQPVGFFDRNPTLDVPPERGHGAGPHCAPPAGSDGEQ
jgi:primary-amine oxidase